MNQPQIHESPQWSKRYIDLVDGDVLTILDSQIDTFIEILKSHRDKADYAYAPGKWTIKELLGHITDTERILVFRLISFARGEEAILPGFDEDAYVKKANFSLRTLDNLCEELLVLRKANMFLFNSLTVEDLDRRGIANHQEMTVRALVFVIAGHIIHHQNIIKERYL